MRVFRTDKQHVLFDVHLGATRSECLLFAQDDKLPYRGDAVVLAPAKNSNGHLLFLGEFFVGSVGTRVNTIDSFIKNTHLNPFVMYAIDYERIYIKGFYSYMLDEECAKGNYNAYCSNGIGRFESQGVSSSYLYFGLDDKIPCIADVIVRSRETIFGEYFIDRPGISVREEKALLQISIWMMKEQSLLCIKWSMIEYLLIFMIN